MTKNSRAEAVRKILGDPHPNACFSVKQALEAKGFDSLADGLAAVKTFSERRRPTEAPYPRTVIFAADRWVELKFSPSGKVLHLFVDGKEV